MSVQPQMKLTLEYDNEVTCRCWNEQSLMDADLMLAHLMGFVAAHSGIGNLSNVFARAMSIADEELESGGSAPLNEGLQRAVLKYLQEGDSVERKADVEG